MLSRPASYHGYAADAASLIAATVKKSAIDAFREGTHRLGHLSPAHRLFRVRTDSKKIDIMAGILDQVFEWTRLASSLATHPTHFGAISAGCRCSYFLLVTQCALPTLCPAPPPKPKSSKPSPTTARPSAKSKLDEHVIVEYRSPFSARSALLKVPKSAIDAYARGDLDLDAFRKKAVWETQ